MHVFKYTVNESAELVQRYTEMCTTFGLPPPEKSLSLLREKEESEEKGIKII